MNTGFRSRKIIPEQTGHGLWEYMLVAYPDGPVGEQVLLEKKYFFDEYREQLSARTLPYITIAHFMAKEEMEETLMRWIQRVCSSRESFVATLNNFSGFPPHTIYLRVQDPQPFRQLAKELHVIDGFVQSNGCPPVTLVTSPCLPIAGRLPQDIYEKAIADYSGRIFHASFVVNELVLMKRRSRYDPSAQVSIFRLPPGPKDIFN